MEIDNKEKKHIKNKSNFLINKYHFRRRIITFIYQNELFEHEINIEEIFENNLNEISTKELKTLEIIKSKYQTLTNIGKKFLLEEWKWERISPLVRAILLYGIYELTFNEPKVVINEMINITKLFSPGEDFKFVNKILDRISKQIIKN
ncbi:transcription antitermination protein NusB [Metamycoplasma canadense]|uniref:Transcription termination factor NusB n=1 Tax=Metamycoplasma canadense TaxID=29554 RepID=A0A077L8I9_9BACT|nr:transcription antitermination protein NusB [Metamycoplasma canadense]BAP39358.1 transcription termination factor NusB [Metamycoplasma canadense]